MRHANFVNAESRLVASGFKKTGTGLLAAERGLTAVGYTALWSRWRSRPEQDIPDLLLIETETGECEAFVPSRILEVI